METVKATLEEIQNERDKVETVIHCMTDGVTGKVVVASASVSYFLNVYVGDGVARYRCKPLALCYDSAALCNGIVSCVRRTAG